MNGKEHGKLETAALYALGALPADEADSFAAHLNDCVLCRDEVSTLKSAVVGLHVLAPEARPRDELRARLLARIRPQKAGAAQAAASVQTWKDWPAELHASGEVIVRSADTTWQHTATRGVDVRRLFVDSAADRVTMLVRMAPGASYPAHRHAAPEECYVLEGDLLSGDRRMLAGDYKWSATESVDEIQSTRGGCLLFIVSSQRDEILPARTP